MRKMRTGAWMLFFGSSGWAFLERHPRWSSLWAASGLILFWTFACVID